MWQRRRQEEHRQQEAQRVERDRRLRSGLLQEEGFHRRRYERQVQEERKERQTERALLKVLLSDQVVRFCLPVLYSSAGYPCNSCISVGRGGEIKQSKTT